MKNPDANNPVAKNLNFNITNSEDEMPKLPNSSKISSDRKLFPKIEQTPERNMLINSLKIEDDPTEKEEKETEWDDNMEIIVRYEFPDFGEWKEIKKNKNPSWVNQVHWTRIILYNYYYTCIIIGCIFYALIGNNFKFICCSNAIDPLFDTFNAIVFISFIFDFVINIIGGLDYIISFYFWTDIVSIILLIFDYSGIRDSIFESNSSVTKTGAYNFFVVLEVLRIIRIITLSKNYFKKKYKTRLEYYTKKLRINDHLADIMINGEKEGEEDDNKKGRKSRLHSRHSMMSFNTNRRSHNLMARTRKSSMSVTGNITNKRVGGAFKKKEQYNESRISRRMIYLTNKRLMMVLLLMLIFVPMFSVFFWTDITYSFETDLNYLVIFLKQNQSVANTYIQKNLKDTYKEYHIDLLNIDLPLLYTETITSVNNLRYEEKRTYKGTVSYTAQASGETYNQTGKIDISLRSLVQIQALLNILRIFLIIFLFLLGIYFFRKDAKEKILNPLERMLSKVRAMAENPSKALALGKEYSDKYNSDITVIEDTIQKIAYLLVLGFGEAGNSLLSKILYTKNEIDFLSEANTIYGIYGFCDIRNFTDATEILTEDVLLFVNAIADVVHEEVDNNEGGANKNIGDAFLVVWRLKNHKNSDIKELCKSTLNETEKEKILSKYKFLEVEEEGGIDLTRLQNVDNNDNIEEYETLKERYLNNLMNSRVCELSLISFLKTIGRMRVDKEITIYNKNKKLLKHLPNFKVKLGYGLHLGWAIEGAIGSYFKIDMSYLSPNVNMSANLEGLTKTYGVPLLFTNSLYNQFRTPKIKGLCRKLDRVMVKGFEDPIELWTVDLNIPRLEARAKELNEKKAPKKNPTGNKGIQSFKNIRIENLPETYLNQEQRNEGDLMYSNVKEEINEENYVDYEEIQRMYEYVIMDENLNILLDLDLPKDKLLNKEIFKNKHRKALDDFITGHWETSKVAFEELLQLKDDIPSKVIYQHMEKEDFIVPHDWKNCRNT